jgi:patatin-related protein
VKERELRLALVCSGGVSLAVYMHGVTKEILKLARASRAYHSIPSVADRGHRTFADTTPHDDREHDTETVYFDVLKAIGAHVDLRVIVDVIAGTSAGGINGIMLARALAHDLPFNGLRRIWFDEADVNQLLAPEKKATKWSKWFLKPAIWMLTRGTLYPMAPDPEMRAKLSTFLRSRWFEPPFDGAHLTEALYETLDQMGAPSPPGNSLLPVGQELELFVTVTDFFGYQRNIPLHDPPIVREREHRHVLAFRYRRWHGGDEVTELDQEHLPGLVFAARATSSFPGAFPPMQIRELEQVLGRQGIPWQNQDTFFERHFGHYLRAGLDPSNTSFVDGSVLNNKPFAEAINSIQGRAAYREVDRRLVYIDPHPVQPPPPPDGELPGWIRTLKETVSDIPRFQPIYDDLAWVNEFNQQVRRVKTVIDAAHPDITRLVAEIASSAPDRSPSPDDMGDWRDAANTVAARNAGYAYEGYVRQKLTAVVSSVATTFATLCGLSAGSAEEGWIMDALMHWARTSGIYPEDGALPRADPGSDLAALPAWVRFLISFDASFRERRLRFVIRTLNQLYAALPTAGLTADRLDQLKGQFYEALGDLRERKGVEYIPPETADAVIALFSQMDLDGDKSRDNSPADWGARHGAEISTIIEDLGAAMDLGVADRQADFIFTELDPTEWPAFARDELLVGYIGFAFWDVLTFSVTDWRELGEFEEIKVDRISPEDARTIREGGTAATLKGTEFGHFGAFFSRKYRENDYLWGRLHAAERLIDIVSDAAARETEDAHIDWTLMKKRAFLAILDREQGHLPNSPDLLAELRREVNRI